MLSEKIYNLTSFQMQFRQVLIDSVKSNFTNLTFLGTDEDNKIIDWNNLLSCASILHQSDKFECLDSSLRIAQHCLNSHKTNEAQKLASAVILEALTNKRSIQLAIKRGLIIPNFIESIPLPFRLEIIGRDVKHSILSHDEKLIPLNKFQMEVYDKYNEADLLSISAPTSAGKSFILSQIILDEVTKKDFPKNIVYIVPTRALISQVEQDIREMLKINSLNDHFVTTVPQAPENNLSSSKIFIFTQERLHWFRTEFSNFEIHLIIIDEAHKIDDGNRGILLQQKIEELVTDQPNIKVYFSSPFTSNPELLLEDFPENKKKSPIKTEFVAVNQNLIYVSQKHRKPKEWEVKLCTKNETIELGEITFPFRPDKESKRLPFVVRELADTEGGNIVYSNGASASEKTALQLFDALPEDYENISSEVEDLIKLIKKTVHSKYLLAKVLTKKIAFHYGNMPLIIRQEIERLFKKGDIHFIICTSTLLEGVNLPAKSIFIRKPTRGQGNPMKESDFWNLAGRAGRWGQEFQGNVICVEPEQWPVKPTMDRSKQKIERAIDKIKNDGDELLQYIRNGSPRIIANRRPELEYGFTYFYTKFLKGELSNVDVLQSNLQTEFEIINEKISIPDSIIFRNPGISPLAQQDLLNFFNDYEGDDDDLIPDLPESTDAVQNSYISLVERINSTLSGDPVQLAYYQAILVVNWMNGYPLSVLIDNSFKYWQRQNQSRKLDRVIRDTMKDVEEFARFKFAKYSSCYIDILRYYFAQNQKVDLYEQIPELNIWLEFGVSQQTQISLIGLGLSRNTAITLSEFIANDSLSRDECLDWIVKNDISQLNISQIMINEINKVVPE